MKNQDLKFHPVALFGLLDMMNGSDRANGAHRKLKIYIYFRIWIFSQASQNIYEYTAEI